MRDFIDIVETTLLELTPYRGSEEFQATQPLRDHPTEPTLDNTVKRMSKVNQFLAFMKSKGYQSLGMGVYGCVFTHPSLQYVIKLFGNDPPYVAYVKWALAHQDNPHVPQFRGKFIKIDGNYFAVRMEKLSRVDDYEIVQSIVEAADVIENHKEYTDRVKGLFEHYPEMEEVMLACAHLCREVGGRFDLGASNIMLRGSLPVLTDPVAGGKIRK